MSEKSPSPQPLPRRSFLTQAVPGVAIGAGAAITIPVATAQSVGGARWEPARHEQDDWLDKIPGKHRLVFDTTDSAGMNSALLYGGNYYTANRTGYGLQNTDLAVVIIARHSSTAYAYNETLWAKYGDQLSNLSDSTKPPSKTNTYARQLATMTERGVHFAVCQMATGRIAGVIASAVGAQSADIVAEITANLLPNSHLVPAGIVVVGRAQDRGYALVHAG
jgi:intracellular sulfur oxidation DsrE/DsrF family protein